VSVLGPSASHGTLSPLQQTFTWESQDTAIALGLSYIGLIDELSMFDRALGADKVQTFHAEQGRSLAAALSTRAVVRRFAGPKARAPELGNELLAVNGRHHPTAGSELKCRDGRTCYSRFDVVGMRLS
jgi:hypothetical protein